MTRSIFVTHCEHCVVGADAHIGPAECTVFTVFFGKFATSKRADVGIGPYSQTMEFPV